MTGEHSFAAQTGCRPYPLGGSVPRTPSSLGVEKTGGLAGVPVASETRAFGTTGARGLAPVREATIPKNQGRTA